MALLDHERRGGAAKAATVTVVVAPVKLLCATVKRERGGTDSGGPLSVI